MSKTEVEITPSTLALKSGTQSQIGRKQLAALEAQAAAGIDGDGAALVGKDGQRLTLSKSGDLWRETDITEEDDGAGLSFRKEYAKYVFAELGGKYKSLTLAPQNLAQLETELEPLLDQNAFILEDE